MAVTDFSQAKPAPWYDRVSDWFNAILVREVRQALKSRQFVATFMLLLAISWVVSVFGLLNSGSALEFGDVGREFFYYFYVALAFAVLVIVPFTAFRSLLSEREQNTFDLLQITTLSPRQIIWGKLLSAGVQLFLYYSAITPFMAFASLLQGFNTASAVVILIGTMLQSMLLTMAALMLAAFAKQKFLQAMFMVLSLVGLVANYYESVSIISDVLRLEIFDITSAGFWWGAAILVVLFGAYFVLFQQVAVSQLTFESDNRSTALRVVSVGQFWLLWGFVGLYCYFRETAPSLFMLSLLACLSVLHWAATGLVYCTEGDFLSRRVRRGVPRNRLLRWLKAPFMPGGGRGYVLVVGHLLMLWVIVAACQGTEALRPIGWTFGDYVRNLGDLQSKAWNTPFAPLRLTTALAAYAIIYLGIATTLARWGTAVSSDIKPAHIRVVAILLMTAGVLFPLLLRATDTIKTADYTLFDLTSPQETAKYLVKSQSERQVEFDWSDMNDSLQRLVAARGYGDLILIILEMFCLLMLLLNLTSFYRAFRDLRPLGDGERTRHTDESAPASQAGAESA